MVEITALRAVVLLLNGTSALLALPVVVFCFLAQLPLAARDRVEGRLRKRCKALGKTYGTMNYKYYG